MKTQRFQNVRNAIKSGSLIKTGAAVFAAGALVPLAHAEDYTQILTGASTDANTNQKAVIIAVIGLAVIGFGVAALLAWTRK